MSPRRNQALQLFFGGLLPLVAYAVIEDQYGPVWGTIAGMILGVGEISYEYYRHKKVSRLTLGSNALVLGLGGITIFTNEGFWFKLQPAIVELLFAGILWGSLIAKKNIFVSLAEKQGSPIPEILKPKMNGICFRLGVFMALHAGLTTYAAFYWSTTAWIWLKGAGLTVSCLLYMLIEGLVLRRRLRQKSG